MRHDPRTARFAGHQSELIRDERAHIAETHRFVLHHGHELIDLCARVAGAVGEQEALTFRQEVLWREGAAEGSPSKR